MIRPRPYLSWSQMNLLERSPETYKKLYLYGDQIPTNRGMKYGKKMADALEEDIATGDIALDYAMSKLPKSGKMEVEIKWDVMGVPIFGKMDSAEENLTLFDEYKTGKYGSWNQLKAVESGKNGQLCFYATAIYFRTRKIPEARLSFVPTVDGEATGEVITFDVNIELKDILNMATRMKKAWKEIGEMCEKELL